MNMSFRLPAASTVAVVLGLAGATLSGCFGASELNWSTSEGRGRPGGIGGSPDGAAKPPEPVPPPPLEVGEAPLRRLTSIEYTNSVNDVFGLDLNAAESWPASGTTTGFTGDVTGQGATADLVDQTLRSAERVADAVVARLSTLHPCATQTNADAASCGASFIEAFARRAYRRPLTAGDREALSAVLRWSLGRNSSLSAALRMVTVVMLQSPHFLYRPETTGEEVVLEGKPAVRLSDHAIATRLSYLLTTSAPDAALLEAADRGQLRTPEELLSHARRLLHTPRGKATVQRFFEEWLHLHRMENTTKEAELFPEFTPQVRASLKKATLARFEEVVYGQGRGDIGELMSAKYSFVDRHTAPLLGLTGTFGDALQRVEITEHPRSGVLTDTGIMAMLASTQETSPVARGLFVWETLLCQPAISPPPDLNVEPPRPDPTLTTRERFARHRADPACAGCHQFFDPPGFALEQYDPIGRFRTAEHGLPIDATGTMPLGDDDYTFNGAQELAALLSKSDLPHKCLTQKWFSFAMGRANGRTDAYSIHALESLPPMTPIRDLFVSLVQTPSFTHRPSTQPEACAP